MNMNMHMNTNMRMCMWTHMTMLEHHR